MNIVETVLYYIAKIFTNTVFVISIYYLGISFFGIVRIKNKKIYKNEKRFALVVAAHNEERVIKDIVKSLNQVDYPKELYDIFVIADNCTDKTAMKAREYGAKVFERNDKEKRGKGYALEWMFNKIFEMEKKYDSVAIFDADNLVSKNFLTEMNKKLMEGYKVVQGYVDSKNPKDSWITGSYSISFWTTNRMFQLSRNNLRLSSQLCGTGFCVDTALLKEVGWGATCLTEDLEFTCKLVMNNQKVGWAHDAILYDEKPLTIAQSWWQRKRWMQGFSDVCSRYFFKLIRKAIKDRDFIALDCALYTVQPITIILIGCSMIISAISYGAQALDIISSVNTAYIFSPSKLAILTILIGFLEFIYTPFILILEKKLDLQIFWYYIIYPIYSLSWLPISIQGIIDKDNKEWSHTEHTRSISIEELEKAN
ncbi:MAG: glycosyltransferase family 2 protein [Clostridiaceae bacterium]|nr:glycosyltransferase family 2 protein [Clostridiaceae bacterium]